MALDRIAAARNTIIQMCRDRGYEITQEELTEEQLVQRISSTAPLSFMARTPSGEPVGIHFVQDEKLPKAVLEKILGDYSSQGIGRLILVVSSKLNPSCNALVEASRLFIEPWLISELQFNVSRHELVMPHRVLSKEEAEGVREKYKVTEDGMPVIFTTDMMCRYVGGRVGDTIEIERRSLTAGKSLYYRMVKRGG